MLSSYSPFKLTKYICSSSSGIVKLVKSENAICFDHGIGDYLTPLIIKSNIINFFLNLVKIFFLNIIGFYNYFSYDSYYTPFFFKKNINKFIDLSKYRIPLFLRNKLSILKLNHKKIVLVLVRSEWHLSKKKPEHSSIFDTFNLKLIQRNCSKNESIIIKYHPSVFLKKSPNESLERKCKDLGYNVINVDSYLPNNLKGMLPAEIIINYFNIKKIVSADGSAVLFNFSHLNNIEKTIDDVPFLSIEKQASHQEAISKLCIAGNNLIPKKILIKNNSRS